MSLIRRLDPALVNKIAAGEVIERPASVVKELVENALDAGARKVVVEVEEGDRRLLRVTDDGSGIDPDDLPMAVESHATSKIASVEDLFSVRSLGFRGEALASIAAVSHLKIASRRRGADAGASIEVRGGKAGAVKAAGLPEGAVVEIRNLFHNVPVRRKFLRSVAVEYSHIAEAMTRFALARPGVRFELHHDGRREFALPPAEDVRPRIAHFFGEDMARALIVVHGALSSASDARAEAGHDGDRTSRPVADAPAAVHPAGDAVGSFTAWIAPPAFSRPSLKGQYIFLNGRHIRDRVVGHAVGEAYRELVMSGRHPVAFLFLDVPPEEVDVNVHPTKIEVRFRRHWRIHDRLVEAVRAALVKADLTPAVRPPGQPGLEGLDPSRVEGAILDYFARHAAGAPELPFTAGATASAGPSSSPPSPAPAAGARPRRYQLHNSYIVEESSDGIVIVDQHALHERMQLESLRRQWEKSAIPRQRLLVPAVLEMSPQDLVRLEDARAALESFGVEWEDFGTNTIAVRTVPDFLRDLDPGRMVRDFLDHYEHQIERPRETKGGDGRTEAAAGLVDEVMHFLACRSAVKAGDALSPAEVNALLDRRGELENAFTCAHGRPVALKLTLGDLERYFKRK